MPTADDGTNRADPAAVRTAPAPHDGAATSEPAPPAGLAREETASQDAAPCAIEVRGLTFRYPGAEADTLRGVDLRIEAGDFVAVVGGNGSGKTTLCKTFNGLVPHFWNGDLAGSVRVNGRGTRKRSVAELAREVGYVFQDFGNQLVRATVRDDVAYAPLNLGLADWRERADDALAALGLEPYADQHIWSLSGGQQHLTALAGALALAPGILVVDEPAAEVDPVRAATIYDHLTRLNRERGVTVVVIEHHAELVATYARSVVLMDRGTVRWHLPTAEALARTADLEAADIPAPQVVAAARALVPEVAAGSTPVPLTVAECTEMLREAVRGLPPRHPFGEPAQIPAGQGTDGAVPARRASAGRDPDGAAAAAGRGPAGPTVPGAGDPASSSAHPAGPGPAAPIAALRGAGFSYRTVAGPRHRVLDRLDLEFRDGERVALVGSNGAGKSTLLRLLTGLALPDQGVVVVDGRDTRGVTAAELAGTVCHVGQRPEQMLLQDSVRADVAMFPRGRDLPDTDELVERVLERMDLTALADRDGRLLSGGQQRRTTLAIALAMRPQLLLLDEPTSSLDLRSRDDVIGLLNDLSEHIRCTVVATHDMHLVAEWARRVVVLDEGQVIADTDPASLFARPEILERARLLPPQIAQVGAALGLPHTALQVSDLIGMLGIPALADSPDASDAPDAVGPKEEHA
ncbi:ABC transporter ATP-binding protein [Myceligenerans crystallogenes]|uniref:ABC transporter domain-containing protein n=1 Tax=Myceligenerans crystallogenes TaxID=316335 RepID=A0ABN2NLI3_9MICO